MSEQVLPRACPGCLRRAWLVASLAGHIEKAVSDAPGSRAREILALSDDDLADALAGSHAGSVLRRSESRDPERMRAAVAGACAWACCRHDEHYPEPLGDLDDQPATLFGRGDPAILRRLTRNDAVTVIGSRRPSAYGRELAISLGSEIASAGFVVVSGMAMGIDSSGHQGALDAEGLTIAVLGTGVDVPYPPRCARLYEQIVARGLVIAELPPGASARRWNFPARNRIMAALGAMTVVVEARERSGSLITAGMAQDLGREIGAVPGRVGQASAGGTNQLLHDGAHVIRGGQDALDALLGPGATGDEPCRGPELDPVLSQVLGHVERGAGTADALARASGLAPGTLASALVRLELIGYVRSDPVGGYERTALAAPES